MSSSWRKQPEEVVDSVLKRAEVSKIARRLKNRLALAQFKTKHGWEDLTLDSIEPRVETEIKRKRLCERDALSDTSSSASDLPYPTRTLMSSPLKGGVFSDAVGSSNGSSGHRKRTFYASHDNQIPSFSKRLCRSPTLPKALSGHMTWKDNHQLAQSSPLKPRRQQHFTTSDGPDLSFPQRRPTSELESPVFTIPSDEDKLPKNPLGAGKLRSSPPCTPPMRPKDSPAMTEHTGAGTEGADLLLYLATSPSTTVLSNRGRMENLKTPPPKSSKMDLPSSMITTPGGGNLFSTTPGQGFDFSDFVNITPSSAWKTPIRTPRSIARRQLTFDEAP